jgi:hypothetical protein
VVVAVLFMSAISGTITYYNGLLGGKNAKITSLDSEIASLNGEIAGKNSDVASLTSQVSQETNLSEPYIFASLGVSQVDAENSFYPYWRLFIQGTAYNIGGSTAYNAGLKVVAYAVSGHIAINMTVTLANGYDYGTNPTIDATLCTPGSTQLGNLTAGRFATVNLDLYHEGVLANWTVTPVWTNTP